MNSTQNKDVSSPYRYIKLGDKVNEGDLRVFYIGNEAKQLLGQNPLLKIELEAESYADALKKLVSNELPVFDIIMVDLPFLEEQSMLLHRLLRNSKSNVTPVIYNISKCGNGKQSKMIRLGIADEVIDFSNLPENISELLIFLKKVKQNFIQKPRVLKAVDAVSYGLNFNVSFKRFLDIVLSLTFIVLLSPLFLLFALLIKLESPGPVIYNSYRAGKGFRVFKFFKFRTMRVGADQMISTLADSNQYGNSNGSKATFFKMANDPRVTRFGGFLRNSSLDELPQLLNVLLGDMSIVGNRPLPLYEASQLVTDEWAERFVGPAGITGLWQVEKRGKPNMSTEERIMLDIDYSRRYDLIMDVRIILKTPFCLIQKSKV
jgi:lipopolysaccharide/colanic/teichoic acid biosynthesis glycosyltransferase